MKLIDLSGQTFGCLTVETRSNNIGKRIAWNCVCVCGNSAIVVGYSLKNGHTKSCGCLRIKTNTKHGMSQSQEYNSWQGMNQRCSNINSINYHRYGGRGISVCKRWINSFENFIFDMGKKPSPQHSIDRIDNDGDYTPDNTRWANRIAQCNNTRRNRFITYKGDTLTISQWAKKLNVSNRVVHKRYSNGWNAEKIFTTPFKKNNKKIEYDGKLHTLEEWTLIMRLPKNIIGKRLHRGWSVTRALTEPVHIENIHPRSPT